MAQSASLQFQADQLGITGIVLQKQDAQLVVHGQGTVQPLIGSQTGCFFLDRMNLCLAELGNLSGQLRRENYWTCHKNTFSSDSAEEIEKDPFNTQDFDLTEPGLRRIPDRNSLQVSGFRS